MKRGIIYGVLERRKGDDTETEFAAAVRQLGLYWLILNELNLVPGHT